MTTTTRITVRLDDEDKVWIAEQARDEGVDDATMVRMIVNRLRRNRPPLMRMALSSAKLTFAEWSERVNEREMAEHPAMAALNDGLSGNGADADTVLAQRLAEMGDQQTTQMPEGVPVNGGETAAISLRPVAREKYNPGRH